MERTGMDKIGRGVETLPHYADLIMKTSIDPSVIYSTLIAQRLTVDDGVVNLGPSSFRLLDMTDTRASEMKRFKKNAPKRFIPQPRYITTAKTASKSVSQKMVTRSYDHLNPKSEPTAGGKMVIKGAIISLVRTLEAVLVDSGNRDMASDFDRPGKRRQVIADWVNWALKRSYKIEARFSEEHVRQMLKNQNKYSGRYTTPLVGF